VIARAALLAAALLCAAWFATELRPVLERDQALALVATDTQRAETLLSRAGRHTRSSEPDLRLAQLWAFERRPDRATPILRAIVTREPENFDAWLLLSQTARAGDPALAARAARAYRSLSPPVPQER
jgi:predicted Zn-dependent protease